MTVDEFMGVLERLAPAHLAEDWDNVGLLVGRADQDVTRVLVALDLRDDVLEEAERLGCDVVLTHHPVIFPAIAAVTDATPVGRMVLRAAVGGVAVVAAHTNLDSARGGLNDAMALLLELVDCVPLRPSALDPVSGLGRVGRTDAGTLGELVRRCREAFAYPHVTYVGEPDQAIETVAVCTGSGASLIADAADAGADAYVTGDLKYHDADRAPGLPLVCVPHGAVESVALQAWTTVLEAALPGVEVLVAEANTDPWRVVGPL